MTTTPPHATGPFQKDKYAIVTPSPNTLREAAKRSRMDSPIVQSKRRDIKFDDNSIGCVNDIQRGIFRHAMLYPGGYSRVQVSQRYMVCYELDMNNEDDQMVLQLAIQIWLNTNRVGPCSGLMQSMMGFHLAYFEEDQTRFICMDMYSPYALQRGIQWLTFLDWQENRRQDHFSLDIDEEELHDEDVNSIGLFVAATLPTLPHRLTVFKIQSVRVLNQVQWDGSGNIAIMSEPEPHRRVQDLIAGIRTSINVLPSVPRNNIRRFIYAQYGFNHQEDVLDHNYNEAIMMTPTIYRAILDLAVHLSSRFTNTYVELQGIELHDGNTQSNLLDHIYADIMLDNTHLIRNSAWLEERAPATNYLVQVFQIRYSRSRHTVILASTRRPRFHEFTVTDVGQFM
jgi:hypothetical protein